MKLSENEKMTTMAREFVAPMWLDTDEAKNYVYEQLGELRIIKKQIDEKRQKEDNKRINTEKYY